MYSAESVKCIVSCFADINVIIKGKLIIVTPKTFSWLLCFSVRSLHIRSNCSFSLTPNNMK